MISEASKAKKFKRLIILCDGTGQSSDNGVAEIPTNITRIARGLQPTVVVPAQIADHEKGIEAESEWEIPQVVLYQNGVGTDGIIPTDKLLSSAFGWGLDLHVLEAYSFLANNFEYGDQIFIFGFSRGAFSARALASFICTVGLLTQDKLQYLPSIYDKYKGRLDHTDKNDAFSKWMAAHNDLLKFQNEVTIEILGVFDTVGTLGLPETSLTKVLKNLPVKILPDWNAGYGYHDTSFPVPSGKEKQNGFIRRAYQALSLDEDRVSFGPTLLYNPPLQPGEEKQGVVMQQTWFPGVHTDIGGGYPRAFRDLSDITLAWMIDICGDHLAFHDLRAQLRETTLVKATLDETPKPGGGLPLPLLSGIRKQSSSLLSGIGTQSSSDPKDETDWALSEQHNERLTPTFIAAGAETRKPGQYFLDKRDPATGALKYSTNETIHASVRYRMMKTNYRPPALKGFKLDKDDGGWFWQKTVDLGKGRIEVVRLNEWGVSDGSDDSLERFLLTEEAVRELADEAKSRKI